MVPRSAKPAQFFTTPAPSTLSAQRQPYPREPHRSHRFRIRLKIKAALDRHAELEASQINIDVSGGEVILSGTVESLEEMERVEDAAWSATGVTKIVDNLRVAT